KTPGGIGRSLAWKWSGKQGTVDCRVLPIDLSLLSFHRRRLAKKGVLCRRQPLDAPGHLRGAAADAPQYHLLGNARPCGIRKVAALLDRNGGAGGRQPPSLAIGEQQLCTIEGGAGARLSVGVQMEMNGKRQIPREANEALSRAQPVDAEQFRAARKKPQGAAVHQAETLHIAIVRGLQFNALIALLKLASHPVGM